MNALHLGVGFEEMVIGAILPPKPTVFNVASPARVNNNRRQCCRQTTFCAGDPPLADRHG